MSSTICVERLAHHPDLLPLLAVWFQSEWPAYYGPSGRADAETDLRAYSNVSAVPIGLVAFRDNEVCGVAAPKAHSIASRPNLGPSVQVSFLRSTGAKASVARSCAGSKAWRRNSGSLACIVQRAPRPVYLSATSGTCWNEPLTKGNWWPSMRKCSSLSLNPDASPAALARSPLGAG